MPTAGCLVVHGGAPEDAEASWGKVSWEGGRVVVGGGAEVGRGLDGCRCGIGYILFL